MFGGMQKHYCTSNSLPMEKSFDHSLYIVFEKEMKDKFEWK